MLELLFTQDFTKSERDEWDAKVLSDLVCNRLSVVSFRKQKSQAATQPPSALDLALQKKSTLVKNTSPGPGFSNPGFNNLYYLQKTNSTHKPLLNRISQDLGKQIEPLLLDDPDCLTLEKRIGHGQYNYMFLIICFSNSKNILYNSIIIYYYF